MNVRLKILLILLLITSLTLLGMVAFLWQKIRKFEPVVYYNVPPEKSFIYSREELIFGIENYLKDVIGKEIKKLKEEKKDFLYADLKEMKIVLYQEGEEVKSFPVIGKGADWFLGETPLGVYYANYKTRLHFSSSAHLWMPYAIQFFGNYFIHGWPYDRQGRMVQTTYSGGCIRLNTLDASEIFDFVEEGMPILVFDEKNVPSLFAIKPISEEISFPEIQAQFILVADLKTGEIILNKGGDSQFYGGPAVNNLMLALTTTESVDLDKRIFAKKWMFEKINEGIIIPEKSYRAYDLLKPLLVYSSEEAAQVLTRFRTPEVFVELMQEKAKSLGLGDSSFADLTGSSQENKTSLYDLARTFRYIKDYRKFLLDMADELTGPSEDEKESKFAVFEMRYNEEERTIFIGLANSSKIEEDLEKTLEWLEKNFGLTKT
ncbi:MAG TPA: L,D-transpeptidase family protein [Candidatus Humimicrobiaceae bacterium]|nr:L,D-transpeptidase family protein [Candidatus Humimicrobiaceae bacterium]